MLSFLLLLSSAACSLPGISFRAPVWIINLPVTFTGRFTVVEHHTFAGQSVSCSKETTGLVTVDRNGKVALTTQGGVFSIDANGQCVDQSQDPGWKAEGEVENPAEPYLKFTGCTSPGATRYRAEGSAEHVVAEYQQTTQTGKLTGGVTCYDEKNKPVSELSFYLMGTETRQ